MQTHTHPAYPSTHLQQPPLGLTFSTRTLKIEMRSSPPGQKTSLTQETELLESLLQEVEHQVGHLKLEMDSWQDTASFLLTVSADASCNTSTQKMNYSALHLKMLTGFQTVKEMLSVSLFTSSRPVLSVFSFLCCFFSISQTASLLQQE